MFISIYCRLSVGSLLVDLCPSLGPNDLKNHNQGNAIFVENKFNLHFGIFLENYLQITKHSTACMVSGPTSL